jgi:putative intracellular protease/amidase
MKKEVLFVLLNEYADYEPAYISGSINCGRFGLKEKPLYINKVVAPTMDLVRSVGGFYTKPDYTFDTMPADYAALILIGGFGWKSEEAKKLVPIIKQAISKGIIVGAICNAASFLAQNGFLNHIKHTGNGLDELKRWGGDNYTNEAGYQNQQAVSDHGIVTANGTASLEFAVELMRLLKIDTPEDISAYFQFMKLGFCEFMKQLK